MSVRTPHQHGNASALVVAGTGNLTMKLLERAKKVIAIELDPRMVSNSLSCSRPAITDLAL